MQAKPAVQTRVGVTDAGARSIAVDATTTAANVAAPADATASSCKDVHVSVLERHNKYTDS